WTTLPGYIALLSELLRLKLVEAVPPVQLAIRLLVPAGSYLLQLPGFNDRLEPFDPELLGYPWQHTDPRVDALQQQIMNTAMQMESAPRSEVFSAIWTLAHHAADLPVPPLDHADFGETIVHLSEPWYCCAEPTDQQLQSF
ncbi:MAG: CUAEP/CCAEP-tail radical SAM protein, partial [Sulfuriferula sp.]